MLYFKRGYHFYRVNGDGTVTHLLFVPNPERPHCIINLISEEEMRNADRQDFHHTPEATTAEAFEETLHQILHRLGLQ